MEKPTMDITQILLGVLVSVLIYYYTTVKKQKDREREEEDSRDSLYDEDFDDDYSKIDEDD